MYFDNADHGDLMEILMKPHTWIKMMLKRLILAYGKSVALEAASENSILEIKTLNASTKSCKQEIHILSIKFGKILMCTRRIIY